MNVIVLWNTLYLNKAIGYLRANDMEIRNADIHRLTPLGFDHIGLKVAELPPLSQLEAYMIMFPQETPQGPTETPQDDTQESQEAAVPESSRWERFKN